METAPAEIIRLPSSLNYVSNSVLTRREEKLLDRIPFTDTIEMYLMKRFPGLPEGAYTMLAKDFFYSPYIKDEYDQPTELSSEDLSIKHSG
jgi:hypothetical protein